MYWVPECNPTLLDKLRLHMTKKTTYNFWRFLSEFSKSKKFLITIVLLLIIVAILLATGYISFHNGSLSVGIQQTKTDSTKTAPNFSQSSTGNQSPNIQSNGDVNVSYGDLKNVDTPQQKKADSLKK